MGNLIKINTYTERKISNCKIIDIRTLKENLIDYKSWLKNTHREDKIENYEKFLQAK